MSDAGWLATIAFGIASAAALIVRGLYRPGRDAELDEASKIPLKSEDEPGDRKPPS